MKKKIIALTLAFMFILSSMSVSAMTLKEFINDNFSAIFNDTTGYSTTVAVDADLESRVNGNYVWKSAETLKVAVGDKIDYRAWVDMTKVAGIANLIKSNVENENDAALTTEFNNATVTGSFEITIKFPTENISIPDSYKTNPASGFSVNDGGNFSDFYEVDAASWNTAVAGGIQCTVDLRDGIKVSDIFDSEGTNKLKDLYYTVEGAEITGGAGTSLKCEISVTGNTKLVSDGEVLGDIDYNFKQRDYESAGSDQWVDPAGDSNAITVHTEVVDSYAYMTSTIDNDGTITVDVNLRNNPQITNFTWEIDHDEAVVEPVANSTEWNSDLITTGTITATNNSDGEADPNEAVKFVIASTDGIASNTDNKKLFSVKYKFKDNVEYTEPVFNLVLTETGFSPEGELFGVMGSHKVTPEKVTLTYEECDEPAKYYAKGTRVTYLPTITATEGYTFEGWLKNNTEVVDTTVDFNILEDTTLTAILYYNAVTGTDDNLPKLNWAESYYVKNTEGSATAVNGQLVKNLSGDPNMGSANYAGQFFYIKVDIRDLHNVNSATVSLYHRAKAAAAFGLYELSELAYNSLKEGTFEISALPAVGTEVISGTATSNSSDSNARYTANLDITTHIKEKVDAGDDFVYFVLKNNTSRTGEGTKGPKADHIVMYDFINSSYITYTTNDGIPAYFDCADTIYASENSAITLPKATPERGKVVTGWSDGTKTYSVGAPYTLSAPVRFTAVYAEGAVYNVDYISETTTWFETTTGTFTLPAANDKIGYTFEGWTTDNGATILKADTEQTITTDTRYVAVYSKILEFVDYYFVNYSGLATNKPSGKHMLPRLARSEADVKVGTLYTSINISDLENVINKTEWYIENARIKQSNNVLTVFPVTSGEYSTVFSGLNVGETSSTAISLDSITLGDAVSSLTISSSSNSALERNLLLDNLEDYINTAVASGETSLKLAIKTISRYSTNAHSDDNFYINDSGADDFETYLKVMVLASAK